MKEYIAYFFVALISLFMAGYSVHMIIGGSVSETMEQRIIAAVLFLLVIVLAFMAKDLTKKRG
ncbi:MAG: hypothetical protein K2P57_01230 [Burkholderiales bacterium]|nr:hypothetical protein [Burkholderiales bacterium]